MFDIKIVLSRCKMRKIEFKPYWISPDIRFGRVQELPLRRIFFCRTSLGWFSPIPTGSISFLPFPIVFPLLSSYLSYQCVSYELPGRVANLISRYAISIYEGATLWYTLIYTPDTNKFYFIRKASVGNNIGGAK